MIHPSIPPHQTTQPPPPTLPLSHLHTTALHDGALHNTALAAGFDAGFAVVAVLLALDAAPAGGGGELPRGVALLGHVRGLPVEARA